MKPAELLRCIHFQELHFIAFALNLTRKRSKSSASGSDETISKFHRARNPIDRLPYDCKISSAIERSVVSPCTFSNVPSLLLHKLCCEVSPVVRIYFVVDTSGFLFYSKLRNARIGKIY